MFSTTTSSDINPPELSRHALLQILLKQSKDELENFIHHYYKQLNLGEALEDFFNGSISDDGFNCLEIAVARDNSQLMEALVFAGAKPGVPGKNGWYLLHWAARLGADNAIIYLIDLRVDLNCRTPVDSETPLMLAAYYNQSEAVILLANAKADLHKVNKFNLSAVAVAAWNDSLLALQALISVQADLDGPTGEPPVITAVKSRKTAALTMLIINGADINKRLGNPANGETALFYSVKLGFVDCLQIILAERKVELDYVYGVGGKTAIFEAGLLGNLEIFELLFDRGADVFIHANTADMAIEKSKQIYSSVSLRRQIYLTNYYYPNPDFQTMLDLINSRKLDIADEYNFKFYRNDARYLSVCDFYNVSYRFKGVLGKKGSFGEVFLMSADKNKYLAVKEFAPALAYDVRANSLDELKELIADDYSRIITEANINFMVHGVGAFFCDHAPLTASMDDEAIHLINVPRCYIAMRYFPGVPLVEYQMQSAHEFFLIFLQLLNKLEEFHDEYIHCDLSPYNIIVNKVNAYKFEVNLIDFGFARTAGEALDTTGFDLAIKAPEFANRFVLADASQDVFAVGIILHFYYCMFKDSMDPEVSRCVLDICTKMLVIEPNYRASLRLAIEIIEECYESYLTAYYRDISVLKNELEYSNEAQRALINTLASQYLPVKLVETRILMEVFACVYPENRQYFIELLEQDYISQITIEPGDYDFRNALWPNLFNVIDTTFGPVISENILQDFLSTLYLNQGHQNLLRACDQTQDPLHYQRLLKVYNRIYYKTRDQDPRDYFSLTARFFGFSKQEKLQASKDLLVNVTKPQSVFSFFKRPAHAQGQLGDIAQRLQRSLSTRR